MGLDGRDYMRGRSVLDGSTLEADASRPWLTWSLAGVFLFAWFVFAASFGPGLAPRGQAAKTIALYFLFPPGSWSVTGAWWQPLTAIWFHDPIRVFHLGATLYLLLAFGPRAERTLRRRRLAMLFFGGVLAADLGAVLAAQFVARPEFLVLGPTGGLFAVAIALAWRGQGIHVAWFGRGPWPLPRVVGISLVGSMALMAYTFEGRLIWPVAPLAFAHAVALGWGILLAPRATSSVGGREPAAKGSRAPRTPDVPERDEPIEAQAKRATDVRHRVDTLLAKIAADGMDGLTEEERAFLQEASKGYR